MIEESAHFEALYPAESRFSEIEKILIYIKNGNSCQIVGLPGAGRSNLLGLLSYNRSIREKHLGENQKWFHFVLCNFSEIRKKPLFEAIKFIFLSLVDSLRERKMEEEYEVLDKIFRNSVILHDDLILFQGLKKAIDFICIEKELTVVFLFDRFEEYLSALSPEFFSNLRILRNRAKYRFSLVFSLNRPLEDLIETMLFADFYEFLVGNIVYLSLLDKPGLDFRISYLEKTSGHQFNDKTVKTIIDLTGGHGKLTRLCFEAVLKLNKLHILSNPELKKFLIEQKNIKGALYEIWNSLLPEEQKALISHSPISNEYLTNAGLIKNNKVAIPLFLDFIKENLNLLGINEKIVYASSTNEIKKGNLTLSEILTSSEFKLLKYLLQNENRIIERDEIIKAVWQDTKSREGVTDQALDQLVFRLRKKIENDPNNPSHLQTVKGRGFRFTA